MCDMIMIKSLAKTNHLLMGRLFMSSRRSLVISLIMCAMALLVALPGFAQVPRAVFAEMGSATW